MGLPYAGEDAHVFSPASPLQDSGEFQFTPQQYRLLIKQVYQEKNPSMMGELDFIFARYEGREEELFSQVCLKYGADTAALTKDLPPRTELEEGELVEAIVRLEEEHDRRMRLLRRKREEVKELTLLIRLGSERRRCHACDVGICRAQRLIRFAGEVCWLVAEESRCAEEEAGSHSHENLEDLHRGTQWVIKELRAILPSVAQEDPQLAELAHHLSTAKLQKPQVKDSDHSDPAERLDLSQGEEVCERLDCESEHWDPLDEQLEQSDMNQPNEPNEPASQPSHIDQETLVTREADAEAHGKAQDEPQGAQSEQDQPPGKTDHGDQRLSELGSGLAKKLDGAEKLDPGVFEQLESM
eukprot:s1858_g10.t1